MENQQVKTTFNFVYFGSYCGNVNFVWNDYDNKFQSSDSIDFTDTWKFECDSIPEIAKEIFEKENCVSDSEGIQIGIYEFTFDIFFQTDRESENKGFAESFEYCMNYINSNPSQFEKSTIQIVCRETENVVFEK